MTTPATDQGGDDPVAALALVVLDTIISEFEDRGLDLPKDRRIVVGELAVEGQVLGVMFGGCHVGPPGNELSQPFRGDSPRTAIFSIELWREISTGRGGAKTARAPRADVVTAQANTTMVDTWVLLEAAFKCDYPGGPGVIASTAPLPPSGGLQGVTLSLSLQVP